MAGVQQLLIAQMTDIHIGFDQNAATEELNLLRCRSTIARLLEQPNRPDMLVLSGDLTDRGDADSFTRLTELFGSLPFPVYPLVGNHDTREELLRAFPDCASEGGFIHYAIEKSGLRILCLDTFEPGRHGGSFCNKRSSWLSDQLRSHPDTPTVIFMHHPPVVSGIDWMDPRADEDWIGNFSAAIDGHDQTIAIHCGHLHRPLLTGFCGIPLGVTPSVAPAVSLDLRPIDPENPDRRELILAEPPCFALHRWQSQQLVTQYQPVGDWQMLASFGPELQQMIREAVNERK